MLFRRRKRVQEEVVVAEVAPQPEPRNWVVNCPKCGAALNLKEGGMVYLCPVCNSVLRVKSGVRLVKDVSKQEKNLFVSISEKAMNVLFAKEQQRAALANHRSRRKRKKAIEAGDSLDSKLAISAFAGYTKEDHYTIDLDDYGRLYVKKS